MESTVKMYGWYYQWRDVENDEDDKWFLHKGGNTGVMIRLKNDKYEVTDNGHPLTIVDTLHEAMQRALVYYNNFKSLENETRD